MAIHILKIPIADSETPTPIPIFLGVLSVVEVADVRVVEGEDKVVGEVGGGEVEDVDVVGMKFQPFI